MSKEPAPLSPSKYNKLLKAAEERSNRHGFTVYALGHTGLRGSEFSRLSCEWLDSEKQMLQVPADAVKGIRSRVRSIPLSEDGVERFEDFFRTRSEVAITPSTVTKRVKSVSEDSLSDNVHSQTLRSTFTTRLLRTGVPQSEIRQLLGYTPSKWDLVPADGYGVAEKKIRNGLY
ncbi:tyrosine-type recombinase/integrase [Natrinema salsiterrestre]|uniref:Tyrosine-type recombinase/integrase n=1 Tax=Natrinema salsiterrestre TaxID=2950540 RepID=A0A9Q4L6Q6_9EURY|nr:tyrosine-type recombinase/integrase [Natrinema salsiterrestre]MDF9746291.1 tyrosine-type recombinase/integrase [Natrinema salsiterrestre]